ncbi:MAG: Hpt domain-containing protein [Lysobacterales bacterium]
MRLQDDIDFTTLTWVKQELDDTLKQAQQALEAYVEDSSDKSQMRFCASYLHQVQGTLRMVELYGAAMVVEEMERLALGLLDGQIKQAEDAYTVLMRGMVQLPDYLERLQSGHRDIPIVLLPLLNDLRACRGEKLLSETALFSPDLGAPLPPSAAGSKAPVAQQLIAANGGRLRLAFQFGLLKWFKGEDVDGNLSRLIAIVDRVRSLCVQLDARRLWWVAAATLEAVLVKGVDASVALKLLIGRVDRELKRLIDAGEAAFSSQPPNDLTKGLLYYVAQSTASPPRVVELRQVYRLDKLMPTEAELKHARGALSGHNRALLDTVGTAIKEDLLRVKDALDLYLRTGSANVEDLAPQGEALHRVADTLGMLGLGVPRRVVLDQRDVLERIVQGKQSAEESALLDIAGSLLYVESSLDDHIDRLGADQRQESVPSSGFELPQAEVRKILDATTKEASANLQQAKQDIVAFIESPWDHSKIEQIPRLLEEISGALRMLNLPEPAALLGGVVRFAEVELLKHRRVPSGDQLDLMADAIASIEFYLEAVKEGRRNRDKILDVTRRSLEALGYWPLPGEEHGEEAEPVAAEPSTPVPSATDFPSFGEGFTTERIESTTQDSDQPLELALEAPEAMVAVELPSTEPAHEPAAPEVVPEPAPVEMSTAVEIAHGDSLEALIVGEPAQEALSPAVQDLEGLRLSSTEFAGPESSGIAAESAVSELSFDLESHQDLNLDLSEPVTPADIATPELPDSSAIEVIEAPMDLAPVFEPEAEPAPLVVEPPVIEAPPVVVVEPTPAPVAVVAPQPPPMAMPPGIHLPDVGFHSVPSDEIDDEIREVFVEEVQDELDNLNRQYPAWKHDLGDLEKLKPVRRSFHTLKGSGRLVGALAIGEYAWKIENMLNRVLDKTIQPTPAVLDLLDHAIEALPGMLAALKGEGQPNTNIGTIMWVAEQLATGQEVWLPKSSPAPAVTAEQEPTTEAGSAVLPIEVPAAEEASIEAASPAVEELPAPEIESVAQAPIETEAAATSPLDVDPMLMEILSSEVSAHLATIHQYLDQSHADQAPPVTEEVLRAVHTLNGALSMVDLPVLTRVVAPLEGYLKRLRARGLQPSVEGVQALRESAQCIAAVMSALEAHGETPNTDALAQRVVALRDDLPAPDHPYHGFGIHDAEEQRERSDVPADEADALPWYEAESEIETADASALSSEPVEPTPEAAALESVELGEAYGAFAEPEARTDAATLESAAVDEAVELTAVFDAAEPAPSTMASPSDVDDSVFGELAALGLADLDAAPATEIAASETPVDADRISDEVLLADLMGDSDLQLPEAPAVDLSTVTADETEMAELSSADELLVSDAVDVSNLFATSAEEANEAPSVGAILAEPLAVDAAPTEAAAEPADEALLADLIDISDLMPGLESGDHAAELDRLMPGLIEEPAAVAEAPGDIALADLDALLAPAEGDADAIAEQSSVDSGETVEVEGAETAEVDVSELEAADLADLWSSVAEPDPSASEPTDVLVAEDATEESVESPRLAALSEIVDPEQATERAEASDALVDSIDFEAAEHEEPLASLEDSGSVVSSIDDASPETADAIAYTTDEVTLHSDEPAATRDAEPVASDPQNVSARPATVAAVEAAAVHGTPTAARHALDVDPEGPLDLPDMDLELLDIFVEEGVDILDHADGMMARLREAPDDREAVASLQRDLHTLKGGARMAGLTPLGDLSHAMESLFEAMAHGQASISRVAIEALERAFDRLHSMVQRVRARHAIALPEQTIARLEAIIEGRELAPLAEEAPAAATVAAVVEDAAPAEQAATAATDAEAAPAADAERVPPAARPRPSTQRRTQLDDDEANARAAQQELIRVRADLLDNLVNFAGEVSIYRSRLEAQMGGFRFNLVEFEQTVSRLREQLRKLEMETEAQILSRFQRESEQSGNTEFDPLELDRFSTLQQLSRALAESVSDLVSIQNLLDDIARQSETLLLQQSRVSSDLQEGLMRTRMVPFESLVPRLRRILRQTAGELGKKAQLKVEGTQGEMDRTVLERMTAPFEHMLRNSLAHGIEPPAIRKAMGKPEEGTVAIKVAREATEVLIQVTDDGGGMNRDAIRRKAVERGLMKPEAQLSDRDIFQFVLEAGFSTAAEVSKVAGRGVGMDVVASEVKQLGGSLEIDSELGKGTRITIRLPFTLAVAQAVLVRLGDSTYAIPMTSITGVTRMPRKELDRRLEQKQLDLVYGGETYQIYDLGDLLRSPVSHGIEETQVPLLMSKTGDQRAAVRITGVIGSKEVVVKSAGAQLSAVPGIFGATIMGDGRVVVILDLAPLVRHGVALRQAPELAAELQLLEPAPEPVARRQPLIMVVDDSITMRKVTTRVLERSNLDVFTAKDGLDAVEQLQDRMPDVILLDIEMPRMDGYEVATYIRNDPRLKHIPIIMITSRTGEKHRQRALEVGVDRYLGKPYQESDLLKNVQDALDAGHAHVH